MGGEGRGNGGMEVGDTVLLSRVREPAGRVALCANPGRLLTTLNFHCRVHSTPLIQSYRSADYRVLLSSSGRSGSIHGNPT